MLFILMPLLISCILWLLHLLIFHLLNILLILVLKLSYQSLIIYVQINFIKRKKIVNQKQEHIQVNIYGDNLQVGLNKLQLIHKHHFHKIEEELYHTLHFFLLFQEVILVILFNKIHLRQDQIFYSILLINQAICGHQNKLLGVTKIH